MFYLLHFIVTFISDLFLGPFLFLHESCLFQVFHLFKLMNFDTHTHTCKCVKCKYQHNSYKNTFSLNILKKLTVICSYKCFRKKFSVIFKIQNISKLHFIHIFTGNKGLTNRGKIMQLAESYSPTQKVLLWCQ